MGQSFFQPPHFEGCGLALEITVLRGNLLVFLGQPTNRSAISVAHSQADEIDVDYLWDYVMLDPEYSL